MRSSWTVEGLAELTAEPAGCGELARGGVCLIFPLYVGVYLLLTPMIQGQLHLRGCREGLELTRRCRRISDSLLAYRLKIPPAKNDVPYHLLYSTGRQ